MKQAAAVPRDAMPTLQVFRKQSTSHPVVHMMPRFDRTGKVDHLRVMSEPEKMVANRVVRKSQNYSKRRIVKEKYHKICRYVPFQNAQKSQG